MIFSPKAVSDVDALTAYGADVWGVDQAARYSGEMRRRVGELAQHPHRFPLVDLIKLNAPIRSFSHGRHRVFYLVQDGII